MTDEVKVEVGHGIRLGCLFMFGAFLALVLLWVMGCAATLGLGALG